MCVVVAAIATICIVCATASLLHDDAICGDEFETVMLLQRQNVKRKRFQHHHRLPLIPYPKSLTLAVPEAQLVLTKDMPVSLSKGIDEDDLAVKILRAHIPHSVNDRDNFLQPRRNVTIRLTLDPHGLAEHGAESYRLHVAADGIELHAWALAGLFYGVQTLKQLSCRPAGKDYLIFPHASIYDSPRFEWRGLHLDVSRHFFNASEVKRLLDVMASYKLNRFHWHLTDDQGWRLPVNGYPKLCEIASLDPNGVRRYYTGSEIRDVVKYAAARHIEVMPEIDVPGHTTALIAAYPELGNADASGWQPPSQPEKSFGVHEYTMGPNPATVQFLDSVVRTVEELFPFTLVHVGGDEAPVNQWRNSLTARNVLAWSGELQVQSLFNKQLARILHEWKRTPAGWDEVQNVGGLPSNAMVFAWRSASELTKAVRAGRKAVNANQDVFYFDRAQGLSDEPPSICCHTPLEKVYSYDPMPAGLSSKEEALVIGGQGQLWSEYFPNWSHVEYMAFPRSIALAERLWTPPEQMTEDAGGFPDFVGRLERRLLDLEAAGVNYRRLRATDRSFLKK